MDRFGRGLDLSVWSAGRGGVFGLNARWLLGTCCFHDCEQRFGMVLELCWGLLLSRTCVSNDFEWFLGCIGMLFS